MLFGIGPSSLGFTALGIPFIGTRIIGLRPLRVTPTRSSPSPFSPGHRCGETPASWLSLETRLSWVYTRIPRRPPAEEASTTLINLYETRNSREGHQETDGLFLCI